MIGLIFDVRDQGAVASAVASLRREGPVLGLVNNAGTGSAPMRLSELGNADFRGMYEVHVEGPSTACGPRCRLCSTAGTAAS